MQKKPVAVVLRSIAGAGGAAHLPGMVAAKNNSSSHLCASQISALSGVDSPLPIADAGWRTCGRPWLSVKQERQTLPFASVSFQ